MHQLLVIVDIKKVIENRVGKKVTKTKLVKPLVQTDCGNFQRY
jgi:hypothetical protein